MSKGSWKADNPCKVGGGEVDAPGETRWPEVVDPVPRVGEVVDLHGRIRTCRRCRAPSGPPGESVPQRSSRRESCATAVLAANFSRRLRGALTPRRKGVIALWAVRRDQLGNARLSSCSGEIDLPGLQWAVTIV
ncbi:Hypothetical protein NTJ_10779 [Nesidiocoris tenuis]|uniref:Uncharacterized protein n=1 Tax=Nesidiocoris tenuis TaxID=355587 RepID=A0ABN7B2Z7_9HEMI|nr:Hypothetical protein NTJ_10779 [Nesidiocoris tenuis]